MTELKQNEIVSAQVLLRAKTPLEATKLTAREIAKIMPPASVVEKIRGDFEAAGFAVGQAVGLSFSITAPVRVFEQFFKTKLSRDARGGIVVGAGGAETLPLSNLSPARAENIEAVTFTPPPDYGPTNSHV